MRNETLKKEQVRPEYFRGTGETELAKLIHSIRELRNTLERIVILTPGSEVEEAATEKKKIKTLAEIEREHIASVLASEEHFERAAEILGITTVTLWRKRKLYGLEKNDSENAQL